MSMLQRILLLSICGLALVSCSILPPAVKTKINYYVLSRPQCSPSNNVMGKSLLLEPVRSTSFIDTQNIIYSQGPLERAVYQFALWAQPPSELITLVIKHQLRCMQHVRSVESGYAAQGVDYTIAVELIEFYHDAETEPGEAKMQLNVSVRRGPTQQEIARKSFSQSIPLKSYDSKSAVEALDRATAETASNIARWLETDKRFFLAN